MLFHSVRRAWIGSTCIARQVGTTHATAAVVMQIAAIDPSVSTSVSATPYSSHALPIVAGDLAKDAVLFTDIHEVEVRHPHFMLIALLG